MSAHKKKVGTTAKGTSSVVVGGAKRTSRLSVHGRLLVLAFGCVVVLAGVIGGTLAITHHKSTPTKQTAVTDANFTPTNDPDSSAANLQAYYDQPISSQSNNKPVQADDYLNKAQLYLGQQQYQTALKNAEQANKLRPNDPTTIETLGDIYAKLGDNAQAISYYQQDITIAKQQSAGQDAADVQATVSYYQQKIDAK
jgi:predicted Zn-dependent protease